MVDGGASRDAALSALSDQQRRVASLVAQGRTNQEIADELGLSPRTVGNYLSHIMTRLRMENRTEVASMLVYLASQRPRS